MNQLACHPTLRSLGHAEGWARTLIGQPHVPRISEFFNRRRAAVNSVLGLPSWNHDQSSERPI